MHEPDRPAAAFSEVAGAFCAWGAAGMRLLQPGSGIVHGRRPQRSVSLVVERGEFAFVVEVIESKPAPRSSPTAGPMCSVRQQATAFADNGQAPRLLVLMCGRAVQEGECIRHR
jgi:hypothetical protein